MKDILAEVARDCEAEIIEVEVMPDHAICLLKLILNLEYTGL